MSLRKWLVRGLVFSVLGGLGLVALAYQAWTSPSAVRSQVLAKLASRFVGATVGLESARLRLLGGIAFSELSLDRRGGADNRRLLYVPSGVIYHDKERLLDGTLALRKVTLQRPVIHLVRERNGKCNWEDVLGPVDLNERVPTVVVEGGTLLVEDRGAPGTPVLEIHEVNLTAVNDPLLSIVVEGTGQTDVAGPVCFSGQFRRDSLAWEAGFELPAVPVGPALVQRLAVLHPESARDLRQLSGTGIVHAKLASRPELSGGVSYDVAAELRGGEFSHAQLPLPLTRMEAFLHCVDGQVPLARLTADLPSPGATAPARLELILRDAVVPRERPNCLEDVARMIDGKVDHLPVSAKLLLHEGMPKAVQEIEEEYRPSGPVSLAYSYRGDGAGGWSKDWTVRPEGGRGTFHAFPYEVEQVVGFIEMHTRSDHRDRIAVDLRGRAGTRMVTLKGDIRGGKGESAVEMDLAADGLPLDDKLYRALKPEYQTLVNQFMSERSRRLGLRRAPIGVADVRAAIRRARGREKFANRYVVTLREGALKYDAFPLPLERVGGVLDLHPDHWECRDFRGYHGAGEIRVDGRSFPAPRGEAPGRPARVAVRVQGRDVPMDADFDLALAPPLRATWRTLALAGNISFRADVVDLPDRPQDVDVGVAVRGCTMHPAFFPYAIAGVGATVHYARGRVELRDVTARHGPAVLGIRAGEVVLKQGGGYYAHLRSVHGDGVSPDAEFFHALRTLPASVRKGVEGLQLRDPLRVETDLVIDAPADPAGRPVIWWDGGAVLHDARLRAGVEMTGVDGRVTCCGRHNGQALDGLTGTLLLERATVLGQPVSGLHARLEMAPDSPEVLRVRDVTAGLFGGGLSGEARVEFGQAVRYEMVLRALGVELGQFGRHNAGPKSDLQGPCEASLYLRGEGSDLSGLRGNGRVDVPRGKILQLPPLLDLVKAFGLRVPDRTAFEEAHAEFEVEGPQVRVQRLELFGNAFSLRGRGTVDLDGNNLNLDFNADWGRLGQVLGAGLNEFPRAISDQLLEVRVRGRLGEPRYQPVPIPGVVGSFNRMFRGDEK